MEKPVAFAEVRDDRAISGEVRVVMMPLERNGGFAAGNNAGIRFSRRDGRAQYVWLLNNDTVVAANALSGLVRAAEADDTLGAVGGTMLYYADPSVVQFAPGGTVRLSTGAMAATREFNFICGGCLLVRSKVFDEIGLLDERFFVYAEDSDFCLRIGDGGWKMGYAPDAIVWHKGGGTTVNGSPFHDYHNVRSSLLLVHKWRPASVPVALGYWMYRAVAPKILRGQWRRLPAVMRAYADALRYMRSA